MIYHNNCRRLSLTLLMAALAGGSFTSTVCAQSFPAAQSGNAVTGTQAGSPANKPAKAAAPAHYQPNHFPKRANMFYGGVWGVDSLHVKAVESGELIRFSWRVTDPEKAAALNDKKASPILYDSRAGVQLVVPSLEKVGQLRQSSTPVAGRSYWMAFSNKGRLVKAGDHVNVVIGQFHAVGLVVD
jgi:hypothetical protein